MTLAGFHNAPGAILYPLGEVAMWVPHPIPYQGSKRKLAAAILSYFPKVSNRLFEPFAGSAAITIACARYGLANTFVVGDSNEPLIRLLDLIVNHPQHLINSYNKLWQEQKGNEQEYYNIVRSQFNKNQEPEKFFYLLARCVKASIRYNSSGEFNQSPDNRRKGATPETMAKHINATSHLLRNKANFINKDYVELIKEAQEDDIIYMDPPYQGVCSQRDTRYLNGVSFDRFASTLEELNERKLSYIISYDGRTGDKMHGKPLPAKLSLRHIEIAAGRSTQETLLGRDAITYESLYLSPALAKRI